MREQALPDQSNVAGCAGCGCGFPEDSCSHRRITPEMVKRFAFEIEDYLFRMHGVISSARALGEAEGILRRVLGLDPSALDEEHHVS